MKGRDLLSLAFRVVAAVFVLAGAGAAVASARFVARSEPVPGTIVDYSTTTSSISLSGSGGPTGTLYYPVVEYTVGDTTLRMIGRRGTSRPPAATGAAVTVLVSKVDATDARLDTVLGIWGSSIILAGLGGLFLVLSAAVPIGFGGSRRE